MPAARAAAPSSRGNKTRRKPRPSVEAPASPSADADAGPRSLIRTLRIIERLAHATTSVSLAALSGELELPKSSLLGLLRPLCAHGYAVHTAGGYLLGPSAFRLAVAIMPTMSLSRAAAPVMRRLVDHSGETALIAVLDRDAANAVYVDKVESARSIRYSVSIGTVRPLHCSAAGRVLLAHADAEFIESFLRRAPFPRLTPQTLTSAAELRALLPRIREQGVALSVGEVSSDVAGFAAPIVDHRGQVVAALAMAAPASRAGADPAEHAERVRTAAREISLSLGHLPAPAAPERRTATRPAARAAPRTTRSGRHTTRGAEPAASAPRRQRPPRTKPT